MIWEATKQHPPSTRNGSITANKASKCEQFKFSTIDHIIELRIGQSPTKRRAYGVDDKILVHIPRR